MGGARINSGPPPKNAATRARRNATIAMTRLPAEGRAGAPPKWPLPADPRPQAMRDELENRLFELRVELEAEKDAAKRSRLRKKVRALDVEVRVLVKRIEFASQLEAELWRDLWRTPQATQWEPLAWTREVAQYVRWKIAAELGDLDASKEARQLADRLGLTPMAMLRLRWAVEDSAEPSRGVPPSRSRSSTARKRAADPRGYLHAV